MGRSVKLQAHRCHANSQFMPLSLTNLSMRFLLGKLFLTWALGEAGGSASARAGDGAVGLWQSLKLGAVTVIFYSVHAIQ